jgi:hypothetical protein
LQILIGYAKLLVAYPDRKLHIDRASYSLSRQTMIHADISFCWETIEICEWDGKTEKASDRVVGEA